MYIQTQLARRVWWSVNCPLQRSNGSIFVPLMADLSPLPLRDMALCRCLLKEQHVTCLFPLFHPSDQRLAVALTASEGRGVKDELSAALSPPYPFFLSHLCCCVHYQPWAIFYPCTALPAVLVCQTHNNRGNDTASFEKGEQMAQQVEDLPNCTCRHTFAPAYLHIKWCILLGWPLNGFDTHYQLSLMWN